MQDFIDHGTDVSYEDGITAVIRKDEWIASRPWHADLVFPDGTVWRGWQEFYRSKKRLIRDIQAVSSKITIIDKVE